MFRQVSILSKTLLCILRLCTIGKTVKLDLLCEKYCTIEPRKVAR